MKQRPFALLHLHPSGPEEHHGKNEAGRDKPLLGIYEFDGEKMKLCFAGPGKERPTAFTSEAGSGQTLTVWVREKK